MRKNEGIASLHHFFCNTAKWNELGLKPEVITCMFLNALNAYNILTSINSHYIKLLPMTFYTIFLTKKTIKENIA